MPRPTADDTHLGLLLEAQRIGRIGSWEQNLRTGEWWWSDECYRLFGYEPQSRKPTTELLLGLVVPDDKDKLAAALSREKGEDTAYELDFRARLADGQIRYFRNFCQVFCDAAGWPERIGGATQDITEIQEAEKRHSRQAAYLEAVMANMPQGISVFDENLKLQLWNAGFLEVLGLPPESVWRGISFQELIRIPAMRGEYGPGEPELYVAALTSRALAFQSHRFERTKPNGRTHLVEGKPLHMHQRVVGFIATYTDITDNKQAESSLKQQYETLHTLIENIPGGVTLMDDRFHIVAHNREFRRLLDLPDHLFDNPRPPMEDLFRFNAHRGEYGPGDPEELVAQAMQRLHNPQPHVFERRRPNGLILEVRGAPLPQGGFVTIYTDITRRRQNEERLALAEKVFTHSPVAIVIADQQQRVVSVNPRFSELTGFSSREVLGASLAALPHHNQADVQSVIHILLRDGSWSGELRGRRKDGREFSMGLNATLAADAGPVRDEAGDNNHILWIFSDISERKQAEEYINRLAHHDTLTGLPNRFSLLARLEQALPEARRYGWSVALLFIDLDRFKVINDTLGHQVGDQLLIEVARRLASTVRESDTVARLGGDEFVIVLPDINTGSDAATVAGKVIDALADPIHLAGQDLHTSPSIGISLYPTDGADVDTIMRNADTAMYHAKGSGRNNYQFYAEEMNKAASERLDLERKLRNALLHQEFTLNFQPQFSAQSGLPTGVEALLRWVHPVDGPISPAKFVPVAEETGLIAAIGDWVLQAACSQVQAWLEAGLPPIRLAVNISARQLRKRDFVEMVAGAIATSGLEPALLELEITESVVMEQPEEAVRILNTLRKIGVTIAIDDFGTGYSSLSYLKRFPIDHLKIDRSFVSDIESDLNDRAIAFGTIALAHSLGLRVIAEGVETQEQLELLKDDGCDEIQGYLLSRPLAADAAFRFLRDKLKQE